MYVNSLTCWAPGGPGNCGPNPSVLPSGQVHFSYGQVDLNQIVNINRALAAGGTGVQLSGFNFSFTAKNGNGWDDGRQDYLAAYVKLYNAGGGLAANYDYSAQTNRKYNWTNFSFNETFASPLAASQYSNAQVGFVGRDNNFWAGNYGPEIFGVSFSLKYRVDPCGVNPAYSPSCAGFGNIVTSGNLANPNLISNGDVVYNSFAINTALKSSGAGVEVYGFNYGYNYSLGNARSTGECVSWEQAGVCGAYATTNPTASMKATLTNSSNNVIYYARQDRNTPNTADNVSYQFLLPSTTNSLSLGNFSLGASTSGNAAIQNMYVNALYKPDPCVTNPLSSTSCPGYATAYAKNMILGSTVASASGPVVASASNSMSSPTGQVDQSQGNTQPEQTQQQQTQQQAQQTQHSGPGPTQDANQNPSVTQDNPSQPSPAQAGPASTSPQPAGGPPQTATASTQQQSSGGGSGPSKLAMSVVKTAQANDKATQTAAVQNAAKTLENASQSSQASSNLAISMNQDMSANSAVAAAAFAGQSTQTSIQASVQMSQPQQATQAGTQTQQTNRAITPVQQQELQTTQVQANGNAVQIQQFIYTPPVQQQDTQITQVAMLKPPEPAVVETTQQSSSGTGITLSRNLFAYNPLTSNSSMSMSMTPPAPTYQPRLESRQYEVETPQAQIASFGGLGKAGNPLSELMMQQQFESMQSNITPAMSSVNRNVQSNELAGGVDIASMASVPTGFNAYSFVLRDSAFYEPKEVYKNQRTIDNERVLRGLTRGSDSLHQRMVDQQYKSGN